MALVLVYSALADPEIVGIETKLYHSLLSRLHPYSWFYLVVLVRITTRRMESFNVGEHYQVVDVIGECYSEPVGRSTDNSITGQGRARMES